jgi:YD repeat-containing protein
MRPKKALILTSLAFVLGASIAAAQTVTYKYDDLGRVVSAVQGSMSTTYSYDSADNRTGVQTTGGSSSSSSSSSSTGGSPPVCSNATTNMNVPTNAGPVSVSVTSTTFFTGNCTDAAGYTLTLATPALPYNFTIAAHQTVPIPYTVSDGHGNTGGATVYFVRP